MVVLGATPKGRLIEQHDIFFGIGHSLQALVPDIQAFWPEAEGKIHIDSWREITIVDGYSVSVIPKNAFTSDVHLFFVNLGGYKKNDLEEYHYKILSVARNMAQAVKQSKTNTFYKHFGFKGAESHIDDKYGIDVDDVYNINDILHPSAKEQYTLQFTKSETLAEDMLHIGYLSIEKLLNTISL